MNTIIIEANARNHLIFALSVCRIKISLSKINKIILIVGHINSKKFEFADIIKFLTIRGIEVVIANRKNFSCYVKRNLVHSMYTFSFVPITLIKFKIMTLSSAFIIRYEEGMGSYSSYIHQIRALIDRKFFYLALRSPLSVFLRKILDAINLTSDYFLLNNDNSINSKMQKSIIRTISEINLFSSEKRSNFRDLACVESYKEFRKFIEMNISSNNVLYKLHPRWSSSRNYNNNKIKSKFYSGYLTAEELVFSNKILRIWGSKSSALVYCAVLFGTISYDVKNHKKFYDKRIQKIFEKYTFE